ncbi:MAG: efflux RND transporter periplasmic adaptor subunit [Armatimonadetes bacterium]|nr:efflux RND transporter periplasmic adaptor subunit [Armatimonadota bacterium]
MKLSVRYIVAILVLVIIFALVLAATLKATEVEVVTVEAKDLVATLAATGVVEGYQAVVAPKITGRVAEVLVEEGESVTQGQALARLEASAERAALREREAALAAAQAGAAQVQAALKQERAASRARVARAEAALEAVQARLRDLEAGSRTQEVESARQAVEAAEADAQLAATDYERVRELHEAGAVSKADLDRARARLTSAQAATRQAREQLALLEEGARAEQVQAARAEVAAALAESQAAQAATGQVEVLERSLAAAQATAEQAEAALSAVKTVLDETELKAPIAGRVARRYVDVGDLSGPSTPAFVITNPGDLWVAAEVDEEDVALVHAGQEVTVTAEALPTPVKGTITEVGAAAFSRGLQQVRAKIVRTRVHLAEQSELLRPGMEVDVNAAALLAEQVLVIPLEALVQENSGDSVWVVADGRLHHVEIETGRRSFREVEVASGLKAGDRVVVSGTKDLQEGKRAKPSAGESSED